LSLTLTGEMIRPTSKFECKSRIDFSPSSLNFYSPLGPSADRVSQ